MDKITEYTYHEAIELLNEREIPRRIVNEENGDEDITFDSSVYFLIGKNRKIHELKFSGSLKKGSLFSDDYSLEFNDDYEEQLNDIIDKLASFNSKVATFKFVTMVEENDDSYIILKDKHTSRAVWKIPPPQNSNNEKIKAYSGFSVIDNIIRKNILRQVYLNYHPEEVGKLSDVISQCIPNINVKNLIETKDKHKTCKNDIVDESLTKSEVMIDESIMKYYNANEKKLKQHKCSINGNKFIRR